MHSGARGYNIIIGRCRFVGGELCMELNGRSYRVPIV